MSKRTEESARCPTEVDDAVLKNKEKALAIQSKLLKNAPMSPDLSTESSMLDLMLAYHVRTAKTTATQRKRVREDISFGAS